MPHDFLEEAQSLMPKVDVKTEQAGLLARFSELLSVGRQLSPIIVFFKNNTRVMAVTARPSEDEADFNLALQEILFLFPSVGASYAMVGFPTYIKTASGDMRDAVVTVSLSKTGAVSEGHVYEVREGGEVVWLSDEKVADDSPMFSQQIDHMFPIFATTIRFPFYPSEIIDFLADTNHEVEFFGEWQYSNINT